MLEPARQECEVKLTKKIEHPYQRCVNSVREELRFLWSFWWRLKFRWVGGVIT